MIKKIFIYSIFIILILGMHGEKNVCSKTLSEEEKLIWVGIGAYNDGFYDIAEKQFSHFIRDYSNHERLYDICYLLGRTLYIKEKPKEAKTIFLKILNESKQFEYTDYTLYWLAEIELKWGNSDGAKKPLVQIISKFPKFEGLDYVHYFLGLIEFGSNRLPQAESSLKKISLISKNNVLIQSSLFWLGILSYRQNRIEEATSYLKTVWENSKSISPLFLKYASIWLGNAQLKLGRFEEAKNIYKTIYERFKQDVAFREIYWKLGFCDYRLGNFKEAMESFQSFKNQYNDSPLILYTHYLLGRIFLHNGDHSSSIKELNMMLTKSREHPLWGAAFLSLFWSHIHQGDFQGANRVFQRLQKLNHFDDEKAFLQWLNAEMIFSEGRIADSLPYYFNILNTKYREKALFKIGKGYYFENKFREAITNFDILLLEFPNSDQAEEGLFIKGECFVQLGNWSQALDTYDLIIQKNRNHHWRLYALTQMGNLYIFLRESEKAERTFKKIVDEFPNHPLLSHAAFKLGSLFFRQNNIGEALHYYSMILKEHRVELWGETYFSLGEIFYQQGKYDKAFKSFETAIQYLQESSPWFFLTQLEIGNLQRKWGKFEDAKRSYMIILSLTKDEELKNAAAELLRYIEPN